MSDSTPEPHGGGTPRPDDAAALRRYLLSPPESDEVGDAGEDLAAAVEARCLEDPAFAEALEAEEGELLLDYLHGELDKAEESAVARQYLENPAGRRKVEQMSRLMAEARGRGKTGSRPAGRLATHRRRLWPQALRLPSALSAAALCLIAVTTSIYLIDLARRGGARQRPLPFTLSPEPGTRATGSWLSLRVPAEAGAVELQVQLRPEDQRPAYRVAVRTVEGVVAASSDALAPQTRAGMSLVAFEVPAAALAPGDYELVLLELLPTGAGQEIGRYPFRVVRD